MTQEEEVLIFNDAFKLLSPLQQDAILAKTTRCIACEREACAKVAAAEAEKATSDIARLTASIIEAKIRERSRDYEPIR